MEVGDGIDLCSDTGRVDSVLTESEIEENKKIEEGIIVMMNENAKVKESKSEEGTMNDVLQALLSDPISCDSRDRILHSAPAPRALPLHIPPLQFPSFSSSLSSNSSITHPLYGDGQSGAQYSEIDPALVLSALHPKSDCPTENGDENCSDYVTDVCTGSTEGQVGVEVEGELDLRASLTSVTDQRVQTALEIISDAVEADRNRNILSSIPDVLGESLNFPCLESNTMVLDEKGVEGKMFTNGKVVKKKDYEFEYKHENPEVIDDTMNDNKDFTEEEVDEEERGGREQTSRRTFTNEETKILSDAMKSLTIDQERREARAFYNYPLLERAEEVVDEVEEEVIEEEVKRMIQALELTEFTTSRVEKNKSEKAGSNEFAAKILESDVDQVMNNENTDTNFRKGIKFQHSSSCESEGNGSLVPLKARRGVENRIMDLDFSCQDEGNAKDKVEAMQDSQPLSKVEPLSSSMASRSYSSEYDRIGMQDVIEGRSGDNHDIGERSRSGTGRMKGTGTGTGQGSRPGTGIVRGQGQGQRQGQGSRPGTGQGTNTDQQERKLSPRPSSSARSDSVPSLPTASYPPSSSAQNYNIPQAVSRPLSRAALGAGAGAGTGLGGGTGTLTSSGMKSLNQPDRIEHQQAVDRTTRLDDPGSVSGNVRGSVNDFDGSYVKAQQLLSLLENSNKDTGRTSTSARSNITASQVGSQGSIDEGGIGIGVGVGAQYARGVTRGDTSSNPGQTLPGSSSRPATAADSLSNSRYGGEEQQEGDGDASRWSKIEKVNLTNLRKGEVIERGIDEEREIVGVRERQRKREREKQTLRSDLAECRVRIEDRRNAAMVRIPPPPPSPLSFYVFLRSDMTSTFLRIFIVINCLLTITSSIFFDTALRFGTSVRAYY